VVCPQALVAQNGALLIGLLFGYTLCYMPTLALTNNIAFHSLANVDKTFPVVRVFGTIGWIIAGIFIGVTGISPAASSGGGALFGGAGALQPDAAAHAGAGERLPVQFRDLLCADAFALLKTRHFLIFSSARPDFRAARHLLRLYRVVSGGCRRCGCQHRHVLRPDVRDRLYAGDPAAVPPSGVKYMLLIGMAAWFVRYAFFALGVSEEGASCSISAFCCTACATTFSLSSALSTPTAWRARR
jgi:uncharacterized membrane protein YjjB (DUF3815 family)